MKSGSWRRQGIFSCIAMRSTHCPQSGEAQVVFSGPALRQPVRQLSGGGDARRARRLRDRALQHDDVPA